MDMPITVAVAVLGSVLCLLLPRRHALVPLAVAMCMYPSNMLLPPEGAGLTAQRVIAALLLARCVISSDIRSTFKWGVADWVAAAYFLLLLISQSISQGIEPAIVNRGGFFLSAMAPFWCARFLVVDRSAFYTTIKAFLWAALPLAILGLVFMNTAYSPYYPLMEAGDPNFYATVKDSDMRMFLGRMFYRAHAPFQQCIMFGWFFAILFVPATNLFFEHRRVGSWVLPWLALPLGVISAVAAGPMMFAALSFAILCLFPWRQQGRTFLWILVIGYAGLSLLATRSPMELMASFGMDPASSYYRVGLVDEVLKRGGMGGHWLTGYGEVPSSFGRFTDLCIHWVCVLVFNGLMGLVGFYGLIAVCFWTLWKARQRAASLEDQWLLWSMMATLIGSLAAMAVVALFSEMYYIYHLFLALVINTPLMLGSATRQVGILAQTGDGRTVLLRYTLGPGQRLAVVRPKSQ